MQAISNTAESGSGGVVDLLGEPWRIEDLVAAIDAGDRSVAVKLIEQLRVDRRARRSEAPALEALCTAVRPKVMSFLTRRVNGDVETAEEAWNDALLRVYCRAHRWDPSRSTLKTWVFNQASWALSDLLRTRKRHPPPIEIDEREDRLFSFSEPLSLRESRALARALKRLSLRDLKLVYLRYFLDCSDAQIATHQLDVGLPADHVRQYIARMRKRLAREYERELAAASDESGPVSKPRLVVLEALRNAEPVAELRWCTEPPAEAKVLQRAILTALGTDKGEPDADEFDPFISDPAVAELSDDDVEREIATSDFEAAESSSAPSEARRAVARWNQLTAR